MLRRAAGNYMWAWGHGEYTAVGDFLPQLEKTEKFQWVDVFVKWKLSSLFMAQVGHSACFSSLLQWDGGSAQQEHENYTSWCSRLSPYTLNSAARQTKRFQKWGVSSALPWLLGQLSVVFLRPWERVLCGDGNITGTWCAVGLVWVSAGPASLLHPWQRFDHCRAQGGAGKGLFAPPCASQQSNLCPGCSTVAEMWSTAEWSTSLSCFSMAGGNHMLSASLKGLQQSQALISLKMPFPPCLGHLFTLPHGREKKSHSGSWTIHLCTVEGLVTDAHLTGCGLNMHMLLLEYSSPAVKSWSCAESFWVELFSVAEF